LGLGKATGGILTVYSMDGCGVRKDDGEGQYKGRRPPEPESPGPKEEDGRSILLT
jgi:hypothetical protein